jgi:hypothetical protein
MIVKRRIPINSLQAAVADLLMDCQSTPLYDDVPEGADLPYITLGNITCKQSGSKISDAWDVSIKICIFSDYDGKWQVNEIINDITTVLSSKRLDLSTDNFNIISQDVDLVEVDPEQLFGYTGSVTLICKIQNVGE